MKTKIPEDIRYFLNELADQLRTDNMLFRILIKFVENTHEDLATVVRHNIELTEDKLARALERLESSFCLTLSWVWNKYFYLRRKEAWI